MNVTVVCRNYFNIQQDKNNHQKEKWKIVTLIVLKILSYMTVIIPLGFAIAYKIVLNKETNNQTAKVSTQAKKRFTYKKVTVVSAPPKKSGPKKVAPKETVIKPNEPMTAEEITAELDKINLISNEDTQAKAYRDIVVQMIKKGDLFEALEHAENVHNKKYIQELKSQLALEFAKIGFCEKALSLAENVYNEPWRKRGQPLDETKESFRLFRDISEIIATNIRQLKQSGHEEEAKRLFEMMPNGKAREIAEKEITPSKEEPKKTPEKLHNEAIECCNRQLKQSGSEEAKEAAEKEITPSKKEPKKTPEQLHDEAVACANRGEFEEAIRIANTITNKTFLAFAKRVIALEIAKNGDLERAKLLAQSIDFQRKVRSKTTELKEEVLAEIDKMEKPEAKIEEEEEEKPLEKSPVDQAIDEAKAFPNPRIRAHKLYQITMGLAKIGNYKKAEKILNDIPDAFLRAKANREIQEIIARRNVKYHE